MYNEVSRLTEEQLSQLEKKSSFLRGAILKMTTLANSGHPGGSMSTIDMLWVLYHIIKIDPKNPSYENRDRVVVSHGHISPAVYSVLASMGFFDLDDAITGFRKAGSVFEGHVEPTVPGVEWATGNLGQGLSAGIGFALACRQKNIDNNIFVFMGDGEQSKGQISEARKFAVKYKLNNIVAVVDYNNLQISGTLDSVLSNNIKENFQADGWKVFEINGHDYIEIYNSYLEAISQNSPSLILAKTVMGKGVSFMENNNSYHGAALNKDQLGDALKELRQANDLEKYVKLRNEVGNNLHLIKSDFNYNFKTGKRYVYKERTDCRSAWGKAVSHIAELNPEKSSNIAVFDCDLQGSVKTDKFEKVLPENFYQAGITEHNTATVSGAMSKEGIQVFFADFGVFGVDETYNQHRLNDINNTNLKVVVTHVGLDVGEDGKTHHCIDYLGLFRNLYNFKVIIPGCPNQTDAIIRYLVNETGNYLVPMGRSKIEIIKNTDNQSIFYDEDYVFEYGKMDLIRDGHDGALIAMGSVLPRAVKVVDSLKEDGLHIQLWNVASPLDIDVSSLIKAAQTDYIFTYEDHNVNTGLGNLIAEKLFEIRLFPKFFKFGVENYSISGAAQDLYVTEKLDELSIRKRILFHKEKTPV